MTDGLASTSEELAALDAEEERLQFDRFYGETAIELGLHLLEAARRESRPLVISIRRGPQRMFHAALPGTSADNDGWIERKCRVVERFGHSSYRVGTQWRVWGNDFDTESRLDPTQFAAHGGAFPIIVRGTGPVGIVGVSGLPQSEDHAFIVTQLEAFLKSR